MNTHRVIRQGSEDRRAFCGKNFHRTFLGEIFKNEFLKIYLMEAYFSIPYILFKIKGPSQSSDFYSSTASFNNFHWLAQTGVTVSTNENC